MELLDILIYLGFANLLAFVLMGMDKKKAKQKVRRIPERTLWGVAVLGGSIGSVIGMNVFRHKTKHTSFRIGMPLLVILHLAIIVYFFMS